MNPRIPSHLAALLALAVALLLSVSARATVFSGVSNQSTLDTRSGQLTLPPGDVPKPIADNATEAGRETNRRIEFTLITSAKGSLAGKTTKGDVETAPDGTPLAPEKPTIKPPARPKG